MRIADNCEASVEGTVLCGSMYLVPCYCSPCGSHPGRSLIGDLNLIDALVGTTQVCINS